MKNYSTQSLEEMEVIPIYSIGEDSVSSPSGNTLDFLRQLARVFYVVPVQSSDLSVFFMN